MRIDELAHRSGVTSRNIRAHQARGLLPPPVLEGRTGFYDEEHLRRLELIDELQQRGFSLEAIRQTLDAWSLGGELSHVLGFERAIATPWTDEQPATYTREQLVARFPDAEGRPDLVNRAIDEGLLEPAPDGRLMAPSPFLIDAGTELARAGVPLAEILDLVAAVRADVVDIAERFIALVDDHVVRPATRTTADDRQVAEAADALRRLRPIALEVVRPFLAQELRYAIERAMHRHDAGVDPGDLAVP